MSLQLLNSAWDQGLTVSGENALSCYDREGYMRVVQMAKPRNDPDHHQFFFFVYQQPSSLVQGTICFSELDYFIKSMHGKGFYVSIYLIGGRQFMDVGWKMTWNCFIIFSLLYFSLL